MQSQEFYCLRRIVQPPLIFTSPEQTVCSRLLQAEADSGKGGGEKEGFVPEEHGERSLLRHVLLCARCTGKNSSSLLTAHFG